MTEARRSLLKSAAHAQGRGRLPCLVAVVGRGADGEAGIAALLAAQAESRVLGRAAGIGPEGRQASRQSPRSGGAPCFQPARSRQYRSWPRY